MIVEVSPSNQCTSTSESGSSESPVSLRTMPNTFPTPMIFDFVANWSGQHSKTIVPFLRTSPGSHGSGWITFAYSTAVYFVFFFRPWRPVGGEPTLTRLLVFFDLLSLPCPRFLALLLQFIGQMCARSARQPFQNQGPAATYLTAILRAMIPGHLASPPG